MDASGQGWPLDQTVFQLIKKHSDILLLVCLAVIVLGAGLGLRDPWPADEPRFALIVRDMVASGNWLIPVRGGEIYPDKPPFFFWVMGGFLLLTGSLKIAFLMPSFLAALGILVLTFDLAKRLWGTEIARYASVLLLLTIQFVLQAKYAQIDALLTFWTTLGLYGFIRYLLLNARTIWLLTGFAACGLGVITKGVGILPLLIFIPYSYALYRGWVASRNASINVWLAGIGALLLPILLWLVPMWFFVESSGDSAMHAYRDNILFRQTITRYGDSWGHIKPAWYFLTQIPALWLPLSLLLPWLIPEWSRRLKNRETAYLLLLGFGVLVLVFFSLSSGKRGVYMLPALPAFILAAAPLMPRLVKNVIVNRTAFAVTLTLGIALLVVAIYLMVDDLKLVQMLGPQTIQYLCVSLMMFSAVALIVIIAMKASRGAYSLSGFILSFWLFVSLGVGPLLDSSRSGRGFIEGVEAVLLPEDELAIVDYREQYLLQAKRPISHFGYGRSDEVEIQDAVAWLKAKPGRYLLVRDHLAATCFGDEGGQIIGYANRSYWRLIDVSAKTQCLGSDAPYVVDYFFR